MIWRKLFKSTLRKQHKIKLRSMSRKSFIGVLAFCAFLVLGGAACKTTVDTNAAALTKPVVLTYWRPFDGTDAFATVIRRYRSIHPNVTIEYRQIRPEIYEQELIEAFAEDRGPDIFAVHNTWMRGYQNKLQVMPDNYQIANIVPKGGLEGKTVTSVVDKRGLTPRQLQSTFVDVALDNMLLPLDGSGREPDLATSGVYGVPLSVDTMMLFYNTDLVSTAGVATPPTTWSEFQSHVEKVTVVDENFTLVRPGAVIGTAENVPRSADLLSLIMMQAGAQMTDDFGFPTFHLNPPGLDRATPPGIDALRFYIDFALPVRKVYTWNALQPDGLEAFIRGQAAYMFGYSYQLPLIQARAPKLPIGIAPVPQQLPDKPINIANFWLEGVSKKSDNTIWAWDFLLFASSADGVKDYLAATKKPTALRALVDEQREDIFLGPFADQILTAQTWYRGKDGDTADAVMRELITSAKISIEAGDEQRFNKVLKNSITKMNQTIQ